MFRSSISISVLILTILLYFLKIFEARVNNQNEFLNSNNHPLLFEKISNHLYQTTMPSVYDDKLQKIYGVSLGGWLVTEPWITPSLYENAVNNHNNNKSIPVDEYTLTSLLRDTMDNGSIYLQNHWDHFYNETDFQQISQLKLNLIRIPIGYWAFELLPNDPYIQGQEKYLDLAIEWATKYNLFIQIGIHGLPGSQNGFDNSGLYTETPTWLENELNMNLTYRLVDYILNKYGNHTTIHSIQLVNEPLGFLLNKEKLSNFYIYCLEKIIQKNIKAKLVLHDAFFNIESWKNFPGEFILDHHLYEVFSQWQIDLNLQQHLQSIKHQGESIVKSGHRSIVGEFSGALTDCAKYLNGVGKGSRWDGSGDFEIIDRKPNDDKNRTCEGHDDPNNIMFKLETMDFLKEQFYTFEEKGNGWIFWCWKTESTLDWDMKRLNEFKMLPDPLFQYNSMNGNGVEENDGFGLLNIDFQETIPKEFGEQGSSEQKFNYNSNITTTMTTSSPKKNGCSIINVGESWLWIIFVYYLLIF